MTVTPEVLEKLRKGFVLTEQESKLVAQYIVKHETAKAHIYTSKEFEASQTTYRVTGFLLALLYIAVPTQFQAAIATVQEQWNAVLQHGQVAEEKIKIFLKLL